MSKSTVLVLAGVLLVALLAFTPFGPLAGPALSPDALELLEQEHEALVADLAGANARLAEVTSDLTFLTPIEAGNIEDSLRCARDSLSQVEEMNALKAAHKKEFAYFYEISEAWAAITDKKSYTEEQVNDFCKKYPDVFVLKVAWPDQPATWQMDSIQGERLSVWSKRLRRSRAEIDDLDKRYKNNLRLATQYKDEGVRLGIKTEALRSERDRLKAHIELLHEKIRLSDMKLTTGRRTVSLWSRLSDG